MIHGMAPVKRTGGGGALEATEADRLHEQCLVICDPFNNVAYISFGLSFQLFL